MNFQRHKARAGFNEATRIQLLEQDMDRIELLSEEMDHKLGRIMWGILTVALTTGSSAVLFAINLIAS